MPRPRSLSADDIAAAALEVVDRDGYASLSMRNVASGLGMSPMALYRYVRDREELERLVADRVLAPLTLETGGGPWTDQITELVRQVRAALGAHPKAGPLLLRHRHDTPNSLRWIERTLGVLAAAGFEGTGRVVAQRAIVHYLFGALQTQQLSGLSGEGTAAMAELSSQEFPYLTEIAGTARAMDPEQEFWRGFGCLLDGLSGEQGPPGNPESTENPDSSGS